jgi:hypothetical protein
MSRFKIEMTIEARRATPKLSMTKELPIIFAVSINVIAFITKRKSPIVIKVIGNVKKTKIGFIKMFNIARIKLAITAVPILSI